MMLDSGNAMKAAYSHSSLAGNSPGYEDVFGLIVA